MTQLLIITSTTIVVYVVFVLGGALDLQKVKPEAGYLEAIKFIITKAIKFQVMVILMGLLGGILIWLFLKGFKWV